MSSSNNLEALVAIITVVAIVAITIAIIVYIIIPLLLISASGGALFGGGIAIKNYAIALNDNIKPEKPIK